MIQVPVRPNVSICPYTALVGTLILPQLATLFVFLAPCGLKQGLLLTTHYYYPLTGSPYTHIVIQEAKPRLFI